MMRPIENLLGIKQGNEESLLFTAMSYDPEKDSLQVEINQIGKPFWREFFQEGQNYLFSKNSESLNSSDPLELWEWLRPGQKDDGTILPQVLLYFWHCDQRLSMDLDW